MDNGNKEKHRGLALITGPDTVDKIFQAPLLGEDAASGDDNQS